MRERLRSHRFRRRLAMSGALVLAATGIVGGAVLIGDTGRHYETPLSNEPAWVYKTPPAAHLTQKQRREVVGVMTRFIQTAVARDRIDEAYDISLPELRGGMTRSEWHTGNIPVVPFPAVGIYDMTLDYSYAGDVAFDVAVIGDGGGIKTFMIEMKQVAPKPNAPWKVAAWVPKGVGGGSTPVSVRHPAPTGPAPAFRGKLGAAWLLIPFAVLGLILLIPAAVGIRGWLEGRRAQRAYAEARDLPPLPDRYNSSSKPS